MKTYYVYILKCNDNTFYTGLTNNINRRLFEHQNNKIFGCYTSKRLPVNLVWSSRHNFIREAILLEKQIKKWSHVKKIALIEEKWDMLKVLSECKNETNAKNHPSTTLGKTQMRKAI
ncbi:MAG: GIY-YIG nuclease family protein [Candidatus Dojkabacteria bacterium]